MSGVENHVRAAIPGDAIHRLNTEAVPHLTAAGYDVSPFKAYLHASLTELVSDKPFTPNTAKFPVASADFVQSFTGNTVAGGQGRDSGPGGNSIA